MPSPKEQLFNMKIYAPNYYFDFKCIADKCTHSCCVGWDVYIDDETQKKYISLDGEIGERARKALCEKDDGVCFAMQENGTCPFLNERGLCDIILQKGEDYISEICHEHPRFYNFFSDRVETGLGLSCEEAARIILGQKKPAHLEVIDEDGEPEDTLWEDEAYILEKRDLLLSIVHQESLSLEETIAQVLAAANSKLPQKTYGKWAKILSSLERLDKEWDSLLTSLANCEDATTSDIGLEYAFKNLLSYFIYRHVSAADKDTIAATAAFACLSVRIIEGICAAEIKRHGSCSFDFLCNTARLYSSEIEYSEENTQKLIELCGK